MPIPHPRPDESHDDFISRCMGAPAMQEYPQSQRYAICESQFRNKTRASVRAAHAGDLRYVTHLQARESEAVGFVPLTRYQALVDGIGRPGDALYIAEADGDRVGFLYATHGRPGGPLHIVQACVQDDARRLEYGSALAAAAEAHASRLQRTGVAVRVAAELPSTAFWEALGYHLVRVTPGGTKRRRLIERRWKPALGALL